MTPEQLIMLIEPILNETLENTLNDIRLWIMKFVPKRTGQLRASLMQNLMSSRVRKGVLRFIVGTHLNYAQKVNEMSTGQVRHNEAYEHFKKGERKAKRRAYAYYYGHYGRIFLNDPEAIGGFWYHLLTYLEKRVWFHLQNAMRRQYGLTPLPWMVR